MALSDEGRLAISWVGPDFKFFVNSEGTPSWSKPIEVGLHYSGNQINNSEQNKSWDMAFTPSGDLLLAWMSADKDIKVARLDKKGNLTQEAVFGTGVFIRGVNLVDLGQGKYMLAFSAGPDTTRLQPYGAVFEPGKGWSKQQLISETPMGDEGMRLALQRDGKVAFFGATLYSLTHGLVDPLTLKGEAFQVVYQGDYGTSQFLMETSTGRALALRTEDRSVRTYFRR
jgi:hypothetical protein